MTCAVFIAIIKAFGISLSSTAFIFFLLYNYITLGHELSIIQGFGVIRDKYLREIFGVLDILLFYCFNI